MNTIFKQQNANFYNDQFNPTVFLLYIHHYLKIHLGLKLLHAPVQYMFIHRFRDLSNACKNSLIPLKNDDDEENITFHHGRGQTL